MKKLLLAQACLLAGFCVFQVSAQKRTHEVFLGGGPAVAAEKSVFNLADDAKAKPDFGYSLGYMYHLTDHLAMGLDLCGYAQTVKGIMIVDNTGGRETEMDLSVTNIALQGRYYIMHDVLHPYLLAMFNFVTGTLDENSLGTLEMQGFGAGVGAGITWKIGERFGMTAEGIGCIGSAWWDNKPFVNSTGKDYDPGYYGANIKLSYYFVK